jgi:hypothetical protein
MAQLKEEWTKPIKIAMGVLEDLHQQKIEQSVEVIAKSMQKILSFVHTKTIQGESATEEEKKQAKRKYQQQIVSLEKEHEQEIEQIWNHRSIEKDENILVLESVGLFSKESASIFGLSQKELIVTGASAGALGGLGIDVALGGGTLFLASLIGGAVGGVGAAFGFDNLYEVKVLGRNLGKRKLTIGPMKNINFPYILLGRSLFYASVLANRSHALRNMIEWEDSELSIQNIIDSKTRERLEKVHTKLRDKQEPTKEMIDEYKEVLLDTFRKLLR